MNPVTIWLLCGVAGLLLELVIPGLIIIFFGCGALLTGISLWIIPALPIEGQLLIFLISSLILLFVFRKILRNRFFNKSKISEDELADEYVGKTVVALTDFTNGRGEIEYKGSTWEAFSTDDIYKGDDVTIIGRESIKLQVKKE